MPYRPENEFRSHKMRRFFKKIIVYEFYLIPF